MSIININMFLYKKLFSDIINSNAIKQNGLFLRNQIKNSDWNVSVRWPIRYRPGRGLCLFAKRRKSFK